MVNRTKSFVTEQTVVQRERWPASYGKTYTPLVYPEQKVTPDQSVLRLENAGSFEHNSSRVANEVVLAGLSGRVVKFTPRGGVVIESLATLVRGVMGVGNQVAGVLTLWSPGRRGYPSLPIPASAILIVPGSIDFAFLQQALSTNVRAVIASSIVARDLEGFLRTDIVQLLNCNNRELAQAHLPPVTLFLTEGLGTFEMPPRILNLFSHYQGQVALLSGITCVQQGIFPELVISLSQENK